MLGDVLLGVVIGAQGLKGEVKVKTFTQTPDAVARYGTLHTKDGRKLRVATSRAPKDDIIVVRFEGVADRNAAEALKGTELHVARGMLPETGTQEFYHADLIGLRADDEEGRFIGKVVSIENYGAGDVIEIARDDGSTVLLPFSKTFVPQVEIENGRIVVAVPEEVETGEKGNVE
ncbi:MAG: ribosome maturation factor RimM [Proteobacteria bacterium]|nr:ribosome maturation factor RimM [Pseudomonadota bacterium]